MVTTKVKPNAGDILPTVGNSCPAKIHVRPITDQSQNQGEVIATILSGHLIFLSVLLVTFPSLSCVPILFPSSPKLCLCSPFPYWQSDTQHPHKKIPSSKPRNLIKEEFVISFSQELRKIPSFSNWMLRVYYC